MSLTAFIDANVPIYAAGDPSRFKAPCVEILHLVPNRPQAFITSAEVLQELLHYYMRRRRWPEPGLMVLRRFETLMRGRIESVESRDVMQAAADAVSLGDVPSRDHLHSAVMRRVGTRYIITADQEFDRMPGVTRLDPLQLDSWRDQLDGAALPHGTP